MYLSFDGYCDGMRLTTPSTGLGVEGTADGSLLGCEAGPIHGAVTKIRKQSGTYVVEFFNTSGIAHQSAIVPDHTWFHYRLEGSHIAYAGSGTWTAPGASVGSSTR